jgi:multimeric flavodoxin WrbA
VLVVAGSPRAGGNSDALAGEFAAAAREAGAEVVTLALRDFDYAGCRECHGCETGGVCVLDDDFARILPHLEAAGAVALAMPVFFMGTPSHLKAMIDRCQCVWVRHWKLGSGKPPAPPATRAGYLLAVSATDFGWQFDAARMVRDAFFLVLGVSPEGALLKGKLDAKDAAAADAELLRRARELGRAAAGKLSEQGGER